jgi:hypothetical protein
MGAYTFWARSGDAVLIRLARRKRMIGGYVSEAYVRWIKFKSISNIVPGRTRTSGQVAPAIINPTQNVHLHETGDTNPEMIGPMIGPREVN